jgi:acylphosphatase
MVQGVGFRASVQQRARTRGVGGWVRNRPDGAVEAVFEGDPDGVDALVEYCRSGPRGSQVDHLDVDEEPVRGEGNFRVTG